MLLNSDVNLIDKENLFEDVWLCELVLFFMFIDEIVDIIYVCIS